MNTQLKLALKYWRLYLVFTVPLLLTLIFTVSTGKEIRCGYVILVMAIYWMTEALPLAVTALIPVFAFPLLGVLPSSAVSLVYMKETVMMFIGGLMVAIAVEHSNLHKRIALFVILHVGQSPRRLMAGFMITTMFLSMWISNTATTAMMVPIVNAVLQELYKASMLEVNPERDGVEERPVEHQSNMEMGERERSNSVPYLIQGRINKGMSMTDIEETSKTEENEPEFITIEPPNEECKAMKHMYFLATAYAANIGGTGSLTGTGPNLVVKENLQSAFPDQNDLNFASWMLFNVPGMLLCTLAGWIWLQILFMGVGSIGKLSKVSPDMNSRVKQLIKAEYKALGRISFHEKTVLVVFIGLVLGWFFREPGFIPGWADALQTIHGDKFKLGDAVPALLAAFLLFVMPSKPNMWPSKQRTGGPSPSCISWEIIHNKMPWGIVILLGGGFAMAEASKASGLSITLGEKLKALDSLPTWASILFISIMTAMATEVASNTATASIIMPILKELALGLCVNPLYFMFPAAICCSYAFMLPVATPPNAIAFGAAGMNTRDMMKAGFVMNILCVLIINVMVNVIGVPMFNLTEIPTWVNTTELELSSTCLQNATLP